MLLTPLADFLTALWETGQVSVPELPPTGVSNCSDADRAESVVRLRWYASEERDALPGTPPEVADDAALWGLTAAFTACSLIVHRQHTVETFANVFDSRSLGDITPGMVYSVDLALRFLPDVHRLAVALAESDPLCNVLEDLGRRWPLSSVGMQFREHPESPPVEKVDQLTAWWHDDCLRRMYVDRIAEREDLSRLTETRVADALRAVMGIHGEMSPKISARLHERIAPSLHDRNADEN